MHNNSINNLKFWEPLDLIEKSIATNSNIIFLLENEEPTYRAKKMVGEVHRRVCTTFSKKIETMDRKYENDFQI